MTWHKFLAIGLLAAAAACRAAPADELTKAARRDDGRAVTTLLLRGVDPNAPDAEGQLAIHVALREDAGKVLASLLAYPALEIDRANQNGETALMLAAIKGKLDWVKKLVARGAAINREGWTPLHYACSGPDDGVAVWLLAQGADIDARSPNGTTPLMMASRYGGITTAEQLLKAGADASLRNEQNLTAADFARMVERDRLAEQLAKAAAGAARRQP